MIGFNIKGIDEAVIKGLGMVGEVRGFCIKPDGVNVEACEGEKNGLCIKKADEGYKIIYKGRTNLYRACAILCGMIEEGTFSELSETAKFDRCGVMIDCSRNAVLKVDAVKQIFSRLAGMGINYAMLYTEDTYEIDDYPYFGYLRGRYTKSEMKEIDGIANDLGIELVPCIQTLAHLPRPFRWSFMEPMRDINDILLIDEPKTYELIDAMFKSWRECTSAKAIHIGMDEAHQVTKGRYTDIHGSDFDRLEVLTRHLKKVCSIAKKYDFEPMMWSDMFFRLVSDGGYYDEDIELPEDLNEKIPEELSLVYWDYLNKREGFNSMIKKHKKTNRKTIFAGGIHTWVGLGPHNKLSFDSMKQGLEACREHGIKKVFATIWGDDGAEVPFYAALPGVQLFAEYNYYDNADNLETRFKQCTGMDMKSFMALELDDLDEEKRVVPWISTSKQVFYNDPLFGLFDKNFENEDMSGIYAKKLERINSVAVPSGMELLFDYYKRLIEILTIKPQLTKDMLSAYKAGNKEKLCECADGFSSLKQKVENLYTSYIRLWESTNKPFGMEVIDLRYGGIITRLNTASRRLHEYCDGKIDSLEELEQERLYYSSKGAETNADKPFPNVHYHSKLISPAMP